MVTGEERKVVQFAFSYSCQPCHASPGVRLRKRTGGSTYAATALDALPKDDQSRRQRRKYSDESHNRFGCYGHDGLAPRLLMLGASCIYVVATAQTNRPDTVTRLDEVGGRGAVEQR